ncbi:MAG: type II secretion system protein GspG [Candidatus Hydrogenedentes bacterium]|nr:type II secretion system protein GspG [Candidatus Hydrogenedentota bacterium]
MSNTGGFTLIELILVTVIIGILAGMVMVNYGGRAREAQIRASKGDIANLSTAIDLFALDNNDTYPAGLDNLVSGTRRYIRELQPDPWGNAYNYKAPTDIMLADYVIFSSGPDGMPGTEDDVTSTSPMP